MVCFIEYINKNFDNALIYFSKVYTKYPKSSFAPNALLHIGLTFKKQNKNDNALAAFKEVIKNYPKSSQANTAKNHLKILQKNNENYPK